jgi:hypothetical protein
LVVADVLAVQLVNRPRYSHEPDVGKEPAKMLDEALSMSNVVGPTERRAMGSNS